jgi:hypothetical protein
LVKNVRASSMKVETPQVRKESKEGLEEEFERS